MGAYWAGGFICLQSSPSGKYTSVPLSLDTDMGSSLPFLRPSQAHPDLMHLCPHASFSSACTLSAPSPKKFLLAEWVNTHHHLWQQSRLFVLILRLQRRKGRPARPPLNAVHHYMPSHAIFPTTDAFSCRGGMKCT